MFSNNIYDDYISIENIFNQRPCLDLFKHYKLKIQI